MSGDFNFRTDRLHNPERVYFDILNARPRIDARRIWSKEINDKLVQRVRVAETNPGTTRVVLDLTGRGGNQHVAAFQSLPPDHRTARRAAAPGTDSHRAACAAGAETACADQGGSPEAGCAGSQAAGQPETPPGAKTGRPQATSSERSPSRCRNKLAALASPDEPKRAAGGTRQSQPLSRRPAAQPAGSQNRAACAGRGRSTRALARRIQQGRPSAPPPAAVR